MIKNNIFGFFNDSDVSVITDIANKLPNEGTLVEIGSFFGRSTLFWAELFRLQNKKYKIYSLDIFMMSIKDVSANINKKTYDGTSSSITPFMRGDKTHYEMTSYLLRDYSEISCIQYDLNYDYLLDIDNINCVFEDTQHTKSTTQLALDKWYPLLTYNGIYAGHDYHLNWPEVKEVADQFANINGLDLITPIERSSVWYFNKLTYGNNNKDSGL